MHQIHLNSLRMFHFLRSQLLSRSSFTICTSRLQHAIGTAISERSKSELLKWGFSQPQADTIVTHLEPYLNEETPQLINSSMACWRKYLRSKKGDPEDTEFIFKDVFVNKEPRLLLLKNEYILERMELLKRLDFLRGHNDLFKMFERIPTGCFLQDWKEFLKKYTFLTYKVLPFIEPEFTAQALNPIFKRPEVLELSYIQLKTRFLFAQRTGVNETQWRKLDMFTLFVLPDDEFVYRCAPNCTLEEYHALEKLNSQLPGEEDDKLFEDLIELAPKSDTSYEKWAEFGIY